MRFIVPFLILQFFWMGRPIYGQEVEASPTQDAAESPAQAPNEGSVQPSSTSSIQSRITVPSKGFSIIPPEGWAVQKDIPGATLFFGAPKQGDTYERNIRIMSFSGPIYIDNVSFEAFSQKIKEKSMKISNSIKNYQIRDLASVELSGGVKGGLFYADFILSDVPMMQMHILVSSAENHFLMTYTDTRIRFEDSANGFLDEAFQSMQSVHLSSQAPSRSDFAVLIGAIIFGLCSILAGLAIFRRRKMSQLGRVFEEYEDEPGDIVQEGEAPLDDEEESWNSSQASDDEPHSSKHGSWFDGDADDLAHMTEPEEHETKDEVGVSTKGSKFKGKNKKGPDVPDQPDETSEDAWKL